MPNPGPEVGVNAIKQAINTVLFKEKPKSADGAEVINLARRKIAGRLPPNERGRFLETLNELHRTKESYKNEKNATEKKLVILESENQSPTVRKTLDDIRSSLQSQYERMLSLYTTCIITDFRFAINQEAKVDRYTGLYLRATLMDEVQRKVLEKWLENPESIILANFDIIAYDLENFKIGNDVYGHDKFDELLNTMAQGLINESRSLTSGDPSTFKTDTYPRLDQGVADFNASMQKYFQENSPARGMLERAKELGIYISPIRDKQGGDEGFFFIEFTQGKSPEAVELSQRLIRHVFENTLLQRHSQPQLVKIRELAKNFPNKIKIGYNNEAIETVSETLGLDKDDVKAVINYLNKLAEVIRSSNDTPLARITDDENCRLRLDATFASGDMDQAMAMFMFGVTPDGNYDPEAGLFNLQGEANLKTQEDYLKHIHSNTDLVREAIGFDDQTLVNEIVRSEAFSPITGSLISYLNKVVEARKKYKKINTIVRALKGDATKLYQIGASEKVGRMNEESGRDEDVRGATLDFEDKLAILLILESGFREKYKNDSFVSGYDKNNQARFERIIQDPEVKKKILEFTKRYE